MRRKSCRKEKSSPGWIDGQSNAASHRLALRPWADGVAPILIVREACLSEGELETSMEIGDKLQKLGIQGLLFPSVTGKGRILVVYLDNCDPGALKLRNLNELKKKIAEFR